LKNRQGDAGENGDDDNDDEEFDQRECGLFHGRERGDSGGGMFWAAPGEQRLSRVRGLARPA
jgi:hypothetical protein